MKNAKFKNYLLDLGELIKEKARAAKAIKDSVNKDGDIDYATGYLMAFYEVVDLMKSQADVFDIPQQDIGIADIDPESELL